MGSKIPYSRKLYGSLLLLSIALELQCASLEDIFNLNQQPRSEREIPYYDNRYVSESSEQKVISRPIKPEDAPEARDRDNANIGKRCIRCDYNRDYYYRDYRTPYDYRSRYDDRYDDRGDDRYYRDYRDRYDDRGRDRYDDRSRDRYYDDYDRRYYDNSRKYVDYNDRRYDDRDRYDRDRYDRRPEYYDTYDRDRYDRDDRYRYYDTKYNRGGYRPWDETTKGTSGFDSSGRGYYFAVGRPEYSTGYATNWNNYDDRNSSRDRWREQGSLIALTAFQALHTDPEMLTTQDTEEQATFMDDRRQRLRPNHPVL
ncbi:hypothetical protein FQR65_LT09246 [Abscondita terminalis]|nr:hypothetical protein FQR65_LT09246 [Abscondita terminalis]